MDLWSWLLGVGATMLVILSVWLVSRTHAGAHTPIIEEDAGMNGMQHQQQPDLTPAGDQLGDDLYTSATGDLSAGGVAMAREAAEEHGRLEPGAGVKTPISDPTPAQVYAREDLVGETERPTFVTEYGDAESPGRGIDPTWAIAGGALVALGGGLGAAWLYSRWQHERKRPIMRLRRQARGFASTLSDRMQDVGGRLPDPDDMRESAPMSGGAAAILVSGLVLARLLHVRGWGQSPTEELASTARDALREASRSRWRRRSHWGSQLSGLRDFDVQSARDRVPSVSLPSVPLHVRPMGVGIGALVGVGAAGYLVWRLLRGKGTNAGYDQMDSRAWYVGSERREQVPNQ